MERMQSASRPPVHRRSFAAAAAEPASLPAARSAATTAAAAAAPVTPPSEPPSQKQLQRLQAELTQLKSVKEQICAAEHLEQQTLAELRREVIRLQMAVDERECEAKLFPSASTAPWPSPPPNPQLQWERSEASCWLRVQETAAQLTQTAAMCRMQVSVAGGGAWSVADPRHPQHGRRREDARRRAESLRAQLADERHKQEQIRRECDQREADLKREIERLPEEQRKLDQLHSALKDTEGQMARDMQADHELSELADEWSRLNRDGASHQPSDAMKRSAEYQQWKQYESIDSESMMTGGAPHALLDELTAQKKQLEERAAQVRSQLESRAQPASPEPAKDERQPQQPQQQSWQLQQQPQQRQHQHQQQPQQQRQQQQQQQHQSNLSVAASQPSIPRAKRGPVASAARPSLPPLLHSTHGPAASALPSRPLSLAQLAPAASSGRLGETGAAGPQLGRVPQQLHAHGSARAQMGPASSMSMRFSNQPSFAFPRSQQQQWQQHRLQ